MLRPLRIGLAIASSSIVFALVLSHSTQARQAPARVDFVRDVQPLLRQRCISCHGPSQQMAGLRLDRRRDAMRGSTFGNVIGPGNGDASRLVLRVSSSARGPQMPPTGALEAQQIALLKQWIDEGAEWPDAAAGDAPEVPADPGAARLMALLRAGDLNGFRRALSRTRSAATRPGTDGITPLHYAALYGDASAVKALLDAGADPNALNAAGASALMWAVDDEAKTRLLVEHGADVNAKSHDGRTPIVLAAARAGSSAVLSILLDKGADPNIDLSGQTALGEAAYAADTAAMRLLIARGADPTKGAVFSVIGAALADCAACIEVLLPALSPAAVSSAALELLPPNDDGDELPMLLDRGANVNAKDRSGRSLLALAAASDSISPAVVGRLLGAGADVNATGPNGENALGYARLRGATPIHQALTAAGATSISSVPSPKAALSSPASSAREAVSRAMPILQRTGMTFRQKSGCVSCHNNTLTARVTAEARRAGIAFDESVAKSEVTGIARFLETWRERALQGLGIPGDADTVSYILLGLADEQHPADPATDAMAHFLKNRQLADGSWRTVAHRPPIESSDITVTALSMRSIQVYAPRALRARYDAAARAAGRWLGVQTPRSTEDRASQLLGLKWAAQGADRIKRLAGALAAEQRPDGGWSQLPTLDSDAYATGQALVALHDGGRMKPTDPVYQRGVAFLLRTQYADGTWAVASRALPIQPLFDIGFPHGDNSWISAAGTNWAVTALALATQ